MGAVSIPPQFSKYLQTCKNVTEESLEMSSDFPILQDDDEDCVFGCNKECCRPASSGKIYNSPVLKRKSSLRTSSENDSVYEPTPSGSRRVSFADEVGKDLVLVRVYSAESFRPKNSKTPRRALSLDMRPSFSSLPSAFAPRLAFDQPSADFKTFMTQLKDKKIALDNIIVTQKSMFGTIKVSNISYAKEVFVRCTFDRWSSFTDIKAEYVPCSPTETTVNPIDTFLFDTTLSKGEYLFHSIEFAVCMKSNGQEYWDNNHDKNYTILFDCWLGESSDSDEGEERSRNWRNLDNVLEEKTNNTSVCRIRRNFCLY